MKRTFFLSLIAVAAMVTGNNAQAQRSLRTSAAYGQTQPTDKLRTNAIMPRRGKITHNRMLAQRSLRTSADISPHTSPAGAALSIREQV